MEFPKPEEKSPTTEYYEQYGKDQRALNPRDESYEMRWKEDPKAVASSFTSFPSTQEILDQLTGQAEIELCSVECDTTYDECCGAKDSGEVRITDPNTGGAKGQKQAQLGAVSPKALMELARVAGFGGEKYERYNFMKGYNWSLSYDALQRHLNAFWGGENTDPESGLSHLAHAAWHCLALLTFVGGKLGTDDRPPA